MTNECSRNGKRRPWLALPIVALWAIGGPGSGSTASSEPTDGVREDASSTRDCAQARPNEIGGTSRYFLDGVAQTQLAICLDGDGHLVINGDERPLLPRLHVYRSDGFEGRRSERHPPFVEARLEAGIPLHEAMFAYQEHMDRIIGVIHARSRAEDAPAAPEGDAAQRVLRAGEAADRHRLVDWERSSMSATGGVLLHPRGEHHPFGITHAGAIGVGTTLQEIDPDELASLRSLLLPLIGGTEEPCWIFDRGAQLTAVCGAETIGRLQAQLDGSGEDGDGADYPLPQETVEFLRQHR